MRDVLDKLDHIIKESVGLANRRQGDRWANPEGQEIIFSDLSFYPERGQYDDPAQLQRALDQVTRRLGIQADNLAWSMPATTNSGSSSSGKFGRAPGGGRYTPQTEEQPNRFKRALDGFLGN